MAQKRYTADEWRMLKELLAAGFTFEHISNNYMKDRTVASLQALARIDESYFDPDKGKTVQIEFSADRIEELIAAEYKLQTILDAIYAAAKPSQTYDDVMFFPSGVINAVLKRVDGVRYYDEFDRVEKLDQ